MFASKTSFFSGGTCGTCLPRLPSWPSSRQPMGPAPIGPCGFAAPCESSYRFHERLLAPGITS